MQHVAKCTLKVLKQKKVFFIGEQGRMRKPLFLFEKHEVFILKLKSF